MRILIIGLNHQIQWPEITSWSSSGELQTFEQGQKDNFAKLLRSTVEQRQVQLVAEEALHGKVTIAQQICEAMGISYGNIEMPVEERNARNIPAGYNEDENNPADERARGNREREEYMAEKILAAIETHQSAIIICGRGHTSALGKMLRDAGQSVETSDLTDCKWYVEDWLKHMQSL